jgi:hypothetical protein
MKTKVNAYSRKLLVTGLGTVLPYLHRRKVYPLAKHCGSYRMFHRIMEIQDSNLGLETSIPRGRCWDRASNMERNATFHTLYKFA